MFTVRRPIVLDRVDIAKLLNQIIAAGGTTALVRPVTAEDIGEWMVAADPARSAWHAALDVRERVVGFQWIKPHFGFPDDAADIATFVQMGQTGLGIGSALFDSTRKAAREMGYFWIKATIRADNEGALIYYQSRGFQDYGVIDGVRLADGQIVDKRLKRFDL